MNLTYHIPDYRLAQRIVDALREQRDDYTIEICNITPQWGSNANKPVWEIRVEGNQRNVLLSDSYVRGVADGIEFARESIPCGSGHFAKRGRSEPPKGMFDRLTELAGPHADHQTLALKLTDMGLVVLEKPATNEHLVLSTDGMGTRFVVATITRDKKHPAFLHVAMNPFRYDEPLPGGRKRLPPTRWATVKVKRKR